MAGLGRRAAFGQAPAYDAAADRRILAALDRPPPAGFARWSAPLLAGDLGNVSDQYV